MYTREQFIADVTAEAKALKEHATKEELGKLRLDILDSNHKGNCIYGQMTGRCDTQRAHDLIKLSCKRFFKNDGFSNRRFERIQEKVNGETCERRIGSLGEIIYSSSIEIYIETSDAQNANLIAFLRDETKELVL